MSSSSSGLPHRALVCPHCNEPLTRPLREAPACFSPDEGRACMVAPVGCWLDDPDPQQRRGVPIAVSVHALREQRLHPDRHRSVGCCGVSYRSGQPNLLCPACHAPIGYLLTDGTHASWAAWLPARWGEAERLPGRPDAEVCALAQRWDRLRHLHVLDPGHRPPATPAEVERAWEALPHLRAPGGFVEPDAVTVDSLPSLMELELWPRPDGRMAMLLDGHPTFLPWPAPELRRRLALGAPASGTVAEPLWMHHEPLSGAAFLDEWYSWRVGEELCVLWMRAHQPLEEHRQFRLSVADWVAAWETARHRLESIWPA